MLSIPRLLFVCGVWAATAQASAAQVPTLDSLIATSLRRHPGALAARARVEAASAGVRPASSLPDPMLMAGIDNLPLGREAGMQSGPDAMTMKMLGISQTLPFPGKLALRRRIAEQQASAAQARADAVTRQIALDITNAFYELMYRDRALQIVRAAQIASGNAERAAEARYVAGLGEQRSVLDARVATARFGERLIAIEQEREAQRAQLAAALADSSAPAVNAADAMRELLRAIERPLAGLPVLQQRALANNAGLRALQANIAALTYQLEASRKEALPDFDFSIRYGQRAGRPDMISASVAVPLPIQKGRKQDELVRGAEAEVAAARAALLDASNRVRAEVAGLRADIGRIRQQSELFQQSILPQARAALESATAGLTTGKVELFSVIQRQTELLEYELALQRLLVDYGERIAQLEAVIGGEVLP